MSDLLVFVSVLLAASFIVFNGLLMILQPDQHRRFLDWVQQSGGQPPPDREGRSDSGRRVAGVGLAALGILFARGALLGILNRTKAWDAIAPGVTQTRGEGWLLLFIGLIMTIGGVYILIQPQIFVNWSLRHQPTARSVTQKTLNVWKMGGRLFGLVSTIAGIDALWIAARHLFAE